MPARGPDTSPRPPELTGATLLQVLVAGDVDRAGKELGAAMKALARHSATLLLDEPTDNLDPASAEALEGALDAFDGTVLAVTHDRWLTRGFDRFVVFGGNGDVAESAAPAWDTT